MTEIIGTIKFIQSMPVVGITLIGVVVCALLIRWAWQLCIQGDTLKYKYDERRRIFDRELADVEHELNLMCELSRQLLPLKADMDRLKADVVGRHAVLKIDEFPQQYAFGIEKCCGFEIDWK